MPRKKKKTILEERKELKIKTLKAIATKNAESSSLLDLYDITPEELQKNARSIEGESVESSDLVADERVFRTAKNELQKELESFSNPVICDMPDFLTNPEKEEERKNAMDKIKYLLKRRFSMIAIADILETNDYDRLDEIINRREEIYTAVEKYTGDEEHPSIKLFSGFKKVVGDEYSRTYAEQEQRMKAAISIIASGKYFKKKLSSEDIELSIEDIIASVIDHPEFNLACQIETEFVNYEADRAIKILSDLRSRKELQDLVEELKALSKISEERAYACSVMDRLITGRERKILPPEEGER